MKTVCMVPGLCAFHILTVFFNLPRQHLRLLFHRSQCTRGVQFHSLAPLGGSLLPNVAGSRYASLVC